MEGLRLLAAIIENNATELLRQISTDLFVDDEVEVHDFVRSHFRSYGELPTPETIEEITGQELPETPESVNYYLDAIRDRALYNNVRPVFGELRAALLEANPSSIRECVQQLRNATRQADDSENIVTAGHLARDYLQAYTETHNAHVAGMTGVPTGWDPIDKDTGGYQRGDLVTWVGRTGMGKTYLLLRQVLRAWYEGYQVLFFSLEMGTRQLIQRMVAMEAGLDPQWMRRGMLGPQAHRMMLTAIEGFTALDGIRIYSHGFGGRTDDVDNLIQEIRPSIVFIDSAYLLRPEDFRRNASKWEQQSNVMDDLKRINIQRDIPIVISTQFARSAGKSGRSGGLENIALTDAISTHSSLIYAIRPWERHKNNKINMGEQTKHYRVIDTLKGREGEDAKFAINYKFASISFDQAPHIIIGKPSEDQRRLHARQTSGWQRGGNILNPRNSRS